MVPAQESVVFAGRNGVSLTGKLHKPAGAGPFPAIIALHGCSGPGGKREADWTLRLVSAGFAVLHPDSFGSRGLGSQCTVGDRTIRSRQRAEDAFAAAEWLASRPDIDRARLGLLGWSNGGTAVLSAARTIRAPRNVEFRQAIAFYPGCRAFAAEDFLTRIPLTILHGLADDWTPAEPCRLLPGVRFIGYADAHHDFDHPELPLRRRKAAFSADGSGTVTVGTNKAAREAAIAETMAILGRM
jgi:dienelactone hydrolase